MNRYDFNGKTVVVTGASMGIGEVFARELHRRGAKLVLVARSRAKLEALAKELGDAQVIAEDLSRPGAAQRVGDALGPRLKEVDVLVNNAGFARFGAFTEVERSVQREQVDLNVTALVELTHLLLPSIEQRRGGVLNVASTAAYQPVPYLAVYAATKAFVLSFSEALWAEYRPRGVRVVALCPGATETPFFARAGEQAAFGNKATPQDVVALGLAAFDANRPQVVHGAQNTMTTWLPRFFTRGFVARLSERLMRPKPGAPALASRN